MRKITFILCILLSVVLIDKTALAGSNSDKSGTTVAQFLKIGVGSRAMGLGGSFVAQANDIYSLYWNPSGITKVKGITFGIYRETKRRISFNSERSSLIWWAW